MNNVDMDILTIFKSEILGGASEKLQTILTHHFASLRPFMPVGAKFFNSLDSGRAGGISFPFHSQSARIGQAKGQALFSKGKKLSYLHHLRDIESLEIKSGDIVLIGDKKQEKRILENRHHRRTVNWSGWSHAWSKGTGDKYR